MGLMIMKNFKKHAFTLSEVMITLSMIGVIAVLTLSTVGASIQQRARLAEFRTAYAKAEEALRGIIMTEERIYQCYVCPTTNQKNMYGLTASMPAGHTCSNRTGGCKDLTTQFLRAMGRVSSCESGNRVGLISEGCIPQNYAPNAGCFSLNNAYILDNGMIIFTSSVLSGIRNFAIDVNGRKGPNKWGQDIFTFSVTATATSKTGDKTYVTDLRILPPNTCLPAPGRTDKNSSQLLQESSNFTP